MISFKDKKNIDCATLQFNGAEPNNWMEPLAGTTKGILHYSKCLEDGVELVFAGETTENLKKMKMPADLVATMVNESWKDALRRKKEFEDAKVV
jgi:hypothetical protein